ncbi:MAG TPA: efflux RND transporter periplasmic adaptor subunit [Gammaproteobacteria bacterium]|nr:efflux RND transporter periplasmic adaptor subunit [Gammaproteobacteria bacterium]
MIQFIRARKKTISLVLLVVMICFFVVHHRRSHQAMPEDRVPVEMKQASLGNIPIEAHVIGTLVAAKHVQITPETAGHVAKMYFQDGGILVKQGTPLVQLDDTTYRAKLESDKANLTYSEVDYNRKVLLGKQGAISQQAIDQALADLKTKKALVQQSEVDVSKMLLVAPFDGVLGKFNVSPGDYVTVGQQIVSLTDIIHLRVEYSVSEKYLSQLKLGQKVNVTTSAYPQNVFVGTVVFISPTINNEDHTISLYADVLNDQRLLTSGLFVNVTQELGMENNALIIPADSLVSTIDGQQVFKIINDKVEAVPVTIGQRIQNAVQVTSGLSAGDKIVVAGQQKLKDGSLIQVNKG